MLAEFIDRIRKLTVESERLEIVHDAKLRRAFVRKGSTFEEQLYPSELRSSTFHALDDFKGAVLDGEICPNPEVFHDGSGAVAFVDRNERKEKIRLPFDVSEPWRRVLDLHNSPNSMTQKALINFLRFEVSVPGVQGLIKLLRKVDFARKSDGTRTVEHGRESFGRQVESEVQGTEEIPEEITIELAVYDTPGLRALSTVSIRCGLLIDVEDERFTLRPLAGEVATKLHGVQVAIGKHLTEALGIEDIPVFYGSAEART